VGIHAGDEEKLFEQTGLAILDQPSARSFIGGNVARTFSSKHQQ
jgi:hypothetical protein